MAGASAGDVPSIAAEAVLVPSETLTSPTICGYDFDKGFDFEAMMDAYMTTGFQATNLAKAIQKIEQMLDWSLADVPVAVDEDEEYKSQAAREKVRCKIWFSYTSNLVSCGLRESIRFLAKYNMVQVMCTTCGGIEEDFIKCMSKFHIGNFEEDGLNLRRRGINRTGNIFVPNANYCAFEDWLTSCICMMHDEQEKDGIVWTPSKMIARLGKEINNEESIYYWAYKNNIPVFSPAITDGSIGDIIYFHSYKRPGFVVDLVQDIRAINDLAIKSRKTGVIVCGGGVIKHHVMNANLMRNGADFCVYVNTANEFDGSDSGARPDEAKSWGKVRVDCDPVKVYAEASLVLPLMIAKTFARRLHNGKWQPEGRVFDKGFTASEVELEKKKLHPSA